MTEEESAKEALAERVAHLEGVVEAEDRSFDHGLESVKHGQMLLIGLGAISIAGAIAFIIYLLQRLDTISLMIKPH